MLAVAAACVLLAGRAWRMGQRREVVVKRLYVKVRYFFKIVTVVTVLVTVIGNGQIAAEWCDLGEVGVTLAIYCRACRALLVSRHNCDCVSSSAADFHVYSCSWAHAQDAADAQALDRR
jgi:hypothetical protein